MPKPRPTDTAALDARADKQQKSAAKADTGPDVASVAQVLADVFPHHLAFTTSGKSIQALPFL